MICERRDDAGKLDFSEPQPTQIYWSEDEVAKFWFAANDESVQAFHQVIGICVGLLAAGGVAAAVGIVNPPRQTDAAGCPGGQLVGAPRPAAVLHDQPA